MSATRLVCAGVLLSAALPGQMPQVLARLDGQGVDESSGVVASLQNRGIFWTHNDSGDGPNIFAFNRSGHVLGKWTVPGARNEDWEDIAIGPGPVAGRWYLYIGDIGDNGQKRRQMTIYRVEEPQINGFEDCRRGCKTAAPAVLRVQYPDHAHNAETLIVHPKTGDLYIVSKAARDDPETIVFVARARQLNGGLVTLASIATLDVPDPLYRRFAGGITGGEISPDGRRVVLCDYLRMYEAVLPAGSKFDDIWQKEFTAVSLGLGLQVEGICYSADGKSVIATSEGSPCTVLEIPVGN